MSGKARTQARVGLRDPGEWPFLEEGGLASASPQEQGSSRVDDLQAPLLLSLEIEGFLCCSIKPRAFGTRVCKSQSMRSKLAGAGFCKYWNSATLFVYRLSSLLACYEGELSSCDRDRLAYRAQNICSPALYRNVC